MNSDRRAALLGVGIMCFIFANIAIFIGRGDFSTWAVIGVVATISGLIAYFMMPHWGWWGTTTVNQYYENNSEHHHYYPAQRRAEGVETVEELPDGTVRTTRQIQRWE